MEAIEFAHHPSLEPYLKHFAPGETLFVQGETSHSMFVIVTGRVLLLGEQGDENYVAGILEEGQILGEKVLFSKSPYQRSFTAKAEIETTVLELTPQDIHHMEQNDPSVITALLRGILKVVAVRFDRANQLVKLLRTSNVHERVVYMILYYKRCSAKQTPKGAEVMLSVDSIHHYVDLERNKIASLLETFVDNKLLVRTGENRYLVPDEAALMLYTQKHLKKAA